MNNTEPFDPKDIFDIEEALEKGEILEIPVEEYRNFKDACAITGADLSDCQAYPDPYNMTVVIVPTK